MTHLESQEPKASWSSTFEDAPLPKPSWLAPPLESQTFPVAATVPPPSEPSSEDPEPQHEPDPAPVPPPSPRLSLVPSGPPYPDLRDENAALRATIAAQTAAIVEIRRAILAASEPEIVRLACAVAQRVARRELTIDPSLVTDWVREAIGGLDDAEPQTLVVAPDFAQAVDLASLSAAFPSIASVEVDPALSSMRCEIRTRASRIDASLEARLAAVVMDLGVVSP